MSAKTMAEVLHLHGDWWWDGKAHCEGCHWSSASTIREAAAAFREHQAAALSAAGFGLVADATDRVGKRYAKLHQLLRDELQAQAWDRGMADQLRLLKAGPGYEMGNPYRKRP